MTSAPLHTTAGRIAFAIVVGAYLVVHVVSSVRSLARSVSGGSQRRDRLSILVIMLGFSAGLLGGLACARRVPGADIGARGGTVQDIVFGVGVVIIGAGAVLREWSIWTLGRWFTFDVRIAGGQHVIDRGPYRWARHPSYTALLMLFAGIGLATVNWLALVVMLVLPTLSLLYRIRVEEEALLDGIGEAYREYAQGRARLVPGIW
jgi:protein-S-isoprenylcysteine O-methyltransferase Ste14